MSGRFGAGRLGPSLGRAARALCLALRPGALSIFLLASAAQATVTTTTASFIGGGGSGDARAAITTGTNLPIARLSGLKAIIGAAAEETGRIETTLANAPDAASEISDIDAFIDVASAMTIDYGEIFYVDPGLITERHAALDIAEIVFESAGENPVFADGNSQAQSTAALDLIANGLGPTTIVKRGAGRFGGGFDFSLVRVFLVLLGTVVAALALARWKLT